MDLEKKQMDIPVNARTMDALTYNCVTAGNYGIYSVVGVYPIGEKGSHALANESAERCPCTTQKQKCMLKVHEFASRLNGFHSPVIVNKCSPAGFATDENTYTHLGSNAFHTALPERITLTN